jgi:hypothetical protein
MIQVFALSLYDGGGGGCCGGKGVSATFADGSWKDSERFRASSIFDIHGLTVAQQAG